MQGYKYIIFANNDILVPYGAIHALRRDLMNEVLVVPLTTLKGAGHNPGQVNHLLIIPTDCPSISTAFLIAAMYQFNAYSRRVWCAPSSCPLTSRIT